MRRTKSDIKTEFGSSFDLERGFSEEDVLWKADYRETAEEQGTRLHIQVDDDGH